MTNPKRTSGAHKSSNPTTARKPKSEISNAELFELLEQIRQDASAESKRVDRRMKAMEKRLTENFDEKVGALENHLLGEIEQMKKDFDKKFEGFDKKFEGFDKKFEGFDKKFEEFDKKLNDHRRQSQHEQRLLQAQIDVGHYGSNGPSGVTERVATGNGLVEPRSIWRRERPYRR